MRAVNLENDVSSWKSGQQVTAQTFMMLDFPSSRDQVFQLLGFDALKMCLLYAIRDNVAGKYDMSAFLPTTTDKATIVYW